MSNTRAQQGTETERVDAYRIIVTIVDICIVIMKFWFAVLLEIIKLFLPREEMNVSGEHVLITGTGHGMGKEMALQYAALGAKVICWDINEKNNLQTAKEIKAAGGQAYAYTVNVMNRNEINETAEKMKKEIGFIGIVVNNAGIMPCHPLLQTTETEIRNMFEINIISHFWIIQAFLPDMMERNQGHFVAMSSCAGLFGLVNLIPYGATKFAVRGAMESLNAELRSLNPQNRIKLTTMYPYIVDTGLCKRPRYRLPSMKPVNPKEAAASIIKAQRTGLEEATVPRHFLYMERIGRMVPKSAMRVVADFLGSGVDSDL